jgi:hypothetical protein
LGHWAVDVGTSIATVTRATSCTADVVAAVGERVDQAGCVEAAVRIGLVVVAGVVAVARCDWKRQRVALQPLANVVVGAGVNSTTLDVTEEIVKRLDCTAARVHALNILYVVVWVRDGAVASVLCTVGLVVSGAVRATHLRLVVRVRVHLVVATVVGRRCEPRNQVSLWVRGRVRRVLTLPVLWTETVTSVCTRICAGLRRVHQDAVVGVRLDVLLQVLGTLEGFATEVALVRLQGNVNSDVGGDVVALDCSGTAVAPLTRKVEVVGAFAADMALAHMVLESLLANGGETKAIYRAHQDRTARKLT